MTIDDLYRKLLRIDRQANYRPEELRRKFLDAFLLPWLEKAEDIEIYEPLPVSASQQQEQAIAQKAQAPALQTVELLRQPRGPPLSLQSEEGLKNYYIAKYLKGLGLFNKNDLDLAYSPLTPINFQNTPLGSDNEEEDYDEENNRWTEYDLPGNSKHITDSLGWYTDVPVTIKNKEKQTVMVIGNFVRIDNGKSEPMLFLGMSNIQKLQAWPK
ncbi:hypothetical protein C2G38_2166264 [Gigaspora rosea]|uniref:Uncharacterized protein n=1 Tax=Gigaspora rosea TaxID=44941 RepID=A0A397VRV7_9GLOM|nr:hypothetical protein C2G38_2166264 [Gigaspora rosea]